MARSAVNTSIDQVQVAISDLVLLSEMQVRTKIDLGTVKRYAQAMAAGNQFPPILVGAHGDALLLLDGFHRVRACRSRGERHIAAEVRKVATLEEARWIAARANLTHGLPYKLSERRRTFKVYVGASQHRQGGRSREPLKSYRQMSADLGVPHTTLRNWMRKDFPSVFAAIGGIDEGFVSPGGLADNEPLSARMARQAGDALDSATAAITGVTDPRDRAWLLEKVEALKNALRETDLTERLPF